MVSARVILTYDDYAALPDDGRRYELYEGELIEMSPSPRPGHQTVIGNLYVLMAEYVRGRGLGEAAPRALPPLTDLMLDPTAVWR